MSNTPPSDKTRAKALLPETLSDANLAHPTQVPADGATGGIVLSAGSRPLPEYELVRVLGRGGFGEVWLAKGPGGFDVALKFVRLGEKVGDTELRALELMKGLRHAHLLPMFGAWQRDGFLIVAMELADGTLLDRLNQAQGQGRTGLPREEVLEYMRDAARGLDYLREAGSTLGGSEGASIQHKDVKPQNLLLVGGSVKVADFGLARVLEHTVTNASGGLTPAYAAPEFFSGQATRWSDQYSLAISYCHLSGGRLPFEGRAAQVMAGHLIRVPTLDMLPEDERAAVARALAKKPEERWPSCRAFVEALHAPAHKGQPPLPARPAPSATAPVLPKRPGTPGGFRRVIPWALGLLALVATGVLGVVWLSGGRAPSTAKVALSGPKKGESAPIHQPPIKPDVKPDPIPVVKPDPPPVIKPKPDPVPEIKPDPKPPKPGPREGRPFENIIGMKFVWIKPGTFRMGSPPGEKEREDDETPHRVTLTKGYHLGAHLVTQYQWEQVMGKDANHSKFMGKDEEEKKRLPVDNVSWEDCQEFCRKLGEREGRRYLLPSEAEWEYACRAGTTTAFWWGDSITPDQANYDGNYTYGPDGKKGEYRQKTTPVDYFKPNRWGLYDMHGNLYQWCADWYGPYGEEDKTDPSNTKKEDARVLRGGSWFRYPRDCRAAARSRDAPGFRVVNYGCRVVLCLD